MCVCLRVFVVLLTHGRYLHIVVGITLQVLNEASERMLRMRGQEPYLKIMIHGLGKKGKKNTIVHRFIF